MRRWLMVLGIVLILVGIVLSYVPIVPEGSHTATVALHSFASEWSGWYQFSENVSGYSLTGVIPVTISWTASAGTDADAAACFGYCHNITQVEDFMKTEGEGTSGSFSLLQPNGGSIILALIQQSTPPASDNFSFSITAVLTVAGPVLLTLGTIAIILAGILRPKGEARRPEVPSSERPPPLDRPDPSYRCD
jgi:hypothetical protein